jgi:glycosyltransferase involved in cell wall biosynthesis
MRILNSNLNPGFEDSQLWQEHTTAVTELDPNWHSRSVLGKAIELVRIGRRFEVILFHDSRLAGLATLIQRMVAPSRCLVFQGLLRDISPHSPNVRSTVRNQLGLWFHRMLVHQLDAVIVHTSAEVELYSRFFKTPRSRFVFVPYFYYEDVDGSGSSDYSAPIKTEPSANILAIGRHRDYDCFIRALAGTPWRGCIVAGASDAEEIKDKIPENIEAHYEVSRAEYRRQIAQSDIVVLPFHADRWQRSLGQIAMFEAMLMRKPVIAAETFQLADYASENEILYYRPGDAVQLRRQIGRLLEDEGLRERLVQSAWERIHAEFTRDRYVTRLIHTCQVAAGVESKTMAVRSLSSERVN